MPSVPGIFALPDDTEINRADADNSHQLFRRPLLADSRPATERSVNRACPGILAHGVRCVPPDATDQGFQADAMLPRGAANSNQEEGEEVESNSGQAAARSSRRFSRARDIRLLTVPTLRPRASAISS